MNELGLKALGIGGAETSTIEPSAGVSYADGKFVVDTSVLTEEKPYAWIKVLRNDIKDADVDEWHWGLFADASSDVDIWDGRFHGATLEQCGNAMGLDSTDLVDGRVIKMWCVKDNEVTHSVSAELEIS